MNDQLLLFSMPTPAETLMHIYQQIKKTIIMKHWIITFILFEALKENPTIITFSMGVSKMIDIMLKKMF